MEIQFRIIWIYLLLLIREITLHKTSKYIGVHFEKGIKLWRTSLYANKKKIHLGTYLTEQDAAKAHDQAVAFFGLNIERSNYVSHLGINPELIKKIAYEKKYPGRIISQYRGVYWSTNYNKWISIIKYKGKCKQLGSFDNEVEAAKKYDEIARYYFRKKAKTNFKGIKKISLEQNRPLTSIYKGVCYNKWKKLWMSTIKIEYRSKHIGYFKTEVEAAIAYNREAKKHGRQLNIVPS